MRSCGRENTGHTYILRQDRHGIRVVSERKGSEFLVYALVEKQDKALQLEAKLCRGDPLEKLNPYGFTSRLSEEVRKIALQGDYLRGNSILENLLSDPKNLEKRIGAQERKHPDFNKGLERQGPEPPFGDPRILPRDSLLPWTNYSYIGTVAYDAGKGERGPSKMAPVQRYNPVVKAGAQAGHSQVYAKVQGAGVIGAVDGKEKK